LTDLETTGTGEAASNEATERLSFGSLVRTTELDTRLLGMLAALMVIWVGFHIWSGGSFFTPRNLWNLSVQTSAVAIMATGMVLVIVSRNIDLSVGSMLAVIGIVMAKLQAEYLPERFGFDHSATWIIALLAGIAFGALLGGFQGYIVAFVRVPAFIVTLGGLLVWRGLAWWLSRGITIAPMDSTFQLLGGGARGNIGGGWSWVVAVLGCLAVVAVIASGRRQRRKFGLQLRPRWAEITIGGFACGAILASVGYLNRYFLPERLAEQRAAAEGIEIPPEGLQISFGLANPVLIAILVAVVMTFIATRIRFGRYVFAIGGNPEAAELGGINTRWTIVKTFALMGVLVAIGSAVQVARLNAAVSGLGQLTELYVIAAAVIGGTSLSGGIGTVPGAMLGALVMQSLQSGMVLVGVDAPVQDIAVGVVLVVAVALDTLYRKRAEQ